MNYLKEQWRQDKLRCALVVCWLLTVAAFFFNSYLLPVQLPGVGTWYAFRTLLPLTALLYAVYAIRTRTFFWKDSTTLEKWCYVFIAVMVLYGAASLPRALDVAWTFRRFFNLCFDLCFFFLMLRLCRQKGLRKLTLAVCFVMWVVVMLLGVYEVFNGGVVDPAYDDCKRFYVFNGLVQYPIVFSGNTNDYALLLTFFYGIFLLVRQEYHIPGWATVLLTAVTYFLLESTNGRLCILSFIILLIAQLLCSLLQHRKAARKTAAGMLLCVCCIQFCTQYRYIIPPLQTYVQQKAEYTQAIREAEKKAGQEKEQPEAETPVEQPRPSTEPEEGGQEKEQPEAETPIEQPKLQLGDPQKESLDEQFFETDEATGKQALRSSGSAGIRAHLLLHAWDCFLESHGLGVGLGNTETLAAQRGIVPSLADKPQNSIHCFIARIIADYGVFILLPLCAIAFLLLKRIFTSLSAAWRRKDGQAAAGALLFFAVLLTYPIVSTASSDAQDDIAMWLYLAMMVLYAVQELETGEHLLTEETHA